MELVERKLLTIIVESALESRLLNDLSEAGITGYTVTMAHGAGLRGQREGDLQGGNVKVECVLKEEVADTIFALLHRDYFPHYACVAWLSPAMVARGENY
jgi:nitrogen regulatory protein P-II 2